MGLNLALFWQKRGLKLSDLLGLESGGFLGFVLAGKGAVWG